MKKSHKKRLFRIILTALIFIPLLILAHTVKLPLYISLPSFLLCYALIGYEVAVKAVSGVFRGQVTDENFLMFIASVGAFFIGEYPEAVAVMLFYQVGELFQDIAVERSRKQITSLIDIRPDRATVLRDGRERTVLAEEIAVGEIIVVGAGERVALDGEVIQGESTLNTSAITGESLPVEVGAGDKILSGVINESGTLRVRVTSEQAQSTVSRILDLVENATMKKAKAESFITRFAAVYTPVVVILAVALAILPPLIIAPAVTAVWAEWVHRALNFLVVSCPCALVISVPMSFFGAMGGAAKAGILFKGGSAIENLDKVSTVFMDKTGTLTEGAFSVTEVFPTERREQLLRCAAIAESRSTHPIALALKGEDEGYEISELSGKGVRAEKSGEVILCGKRSYLEENGIAVPQSNSEGTVIFVALNGEYLGGIVLADTLKKDSKSAISRLKAEGVSTVMLTGDNERTAKSVAQSVGVDAYYSSLLPEDKVERVEKATGACAFVGDGINDAPALATATVGVAMGGIGSDATIEVADIVLMNDNLTSLVKARAIAKKTMRIVKENIAFALGVKFTVLILSAFGLANMWLAVFADVGVALLAVANAMRMLSCYKL